ncbi:MAG: ATP-binding cassette domain-containing protein [Burkholderiales bacterium]|nr:ATP-binding cassette domain-containing protein [Burkholderiales bacterium]
MHNPIHISELNLSFTQKECFNNFSYTLYPGEKIGLIGDNGSGKSSLLRILANLPSLPHPDIHSDETLICGYVPQIIEEFSNLSGGQRFNQALSAALANYPNLLLLDEPTNHLDAANRKSLMRQLRNHPATQIIVTHDPELLNNCVDTLWHIHDGIISVFKGSYANYVEQLNQTKHKLLSDIIQLKQAQKQQHQALMQEQQRAKSSREQGEKAILQRKWPTITSASKVRRGNTTAGKKSANLTTRKNELSAELNQLWQAEEINYSFNFMAQTFAQSIVTINQGSCGYVDQPNILQQINFNLYGNTKIALIGANGSGKSTLLKAIMQDSQVVRHGEWIVPQLTQIAYLDQHYSNLPKEQTVLEYIANLAPKLNYAELRNFLNQFLFRKNEEINKLIQVLSGGEKARLSLAAIALQQPKLLVLDEISNNIDLTTREHLIKILKDYLGAMLIISHDTTFLIEIGVEEKFNVELWQN